MNLSSRLRGKSTDQSSEVARTLRRDPLPKRFWLLWSGSAGSNLGDGVALVALPLMALHLTSNPQLISLVGAAQTIPWLLFGLVAGALVDSADRYRLCVVVNAIRSAGLALFSVLVILGRCDLVAVYVAAALVGTGQVVFDSSSVALVRDTVTEKDLEHANARFMSAEIVAGRFVGQPLGGLLFALRRWVPFIFDAAVYAIASLIMSYPHRTQDRQSSRSDLTFRESLGGVGASLSWLMHNPVLRGLAIRVSIMAVAVSAAQSVLVIVGIDRMGLTPATFGFWLTAEAVGAALGSLVASRVIRRVGSVRSMQAALVLVTGSFVLLAVSRSAALGGVGLVALGFASPLWNVVTISLRQRIVPSEIFGRANSAYMVAVWGGLPIGSVIGGAIARSISLPSVYLFGAAVMVLLLITGGGLYRNLRASDLLERNV
jgi:MFS family permease